MLLSSCLLWIRFPVWRELKLFQSGHTHQHTTLWIRFPVWRELKQFSNFSFDRPNQSLWIRFPVWRELKHALTDSLKVRCFQLWIRFPVWRELKLTKPNWRSSSDHFPLDTLSRLKGIETLHCFITSATTNRSFGYAFPFEGNWNLQPFAVQSFFGLPLDTLSRLKGIETFVKLWPLLDMRVQLWIRFPVWRELKLEICFSSCHCYCCLWIRFPVWRELKPSTHPPRHTTVANFGYAFPFEGNWNSSSSRRRIGCLVSLDTLSRLKGIETFLYVWRTRVSATRTLDTLSRLKGIETNRWDDIQDAFALWIRFPVWRELKPSIRIFDTSTLDDFLWIRFPVWRELKRTPWF